MQNGKRKRAYYLKIVWQLQQKQDNVTYNYSFHLFFYVLNLNFTRRRHTPFIRTSDAAAGILTQIKSKTLV